MDRIVIEVGDNVARRWRNATPEVKQNAWIIVFLFGESAPSGLELQSNLFIETVPQMLSSK